jgi:hypothetical protein
MKVFISSLIAGMEPIRAAARAAVLALGHEPVMAEDFGALPSSPQVACLDGVRQSAAVILILGADYGAKQASGLSATHEEYQEAREHRPILSFVQQGVNPAADQAGFIRVVQAWTGGLYRDGFSDAADLQPKITRALHRMELASATAPFDANEVLARALASFPRNGRNQYGGAILSVAIVGGPAQAVLRPSRMEDPQLAEKLEQEALFGAARIFARGESSKSGIVDDKLLLQQGDRGNRSLCLDGQGGILIAQPIESDRGRMHGFTVILEETLKERLATVLTYAAWLLDEVDATQRLSHIVIAARITGGFAMLTRREYEANPNSIQMSGFGQDERPPVHLTPSHIPRPALVHQAEQLVEDLATLLRRQWRNA